MTSCLYECLYEAGLQRYYPQFTAMGLSRLAHLSQLTMGDYPRLGVQDMADRTRLFHLVQLVKGFEEEEESCVEEDRAADHSSSRRPPPRRQLDFGNLSPEAERRRLGRDRGSPCMAQTDRETPLRKVPGLREGLRRGAPKFSAGTDKEAIGRSTHTHKRTQHSNHIKKERGERRWAEPACRKSLLGQEVAPVFHVQTPGYNYGLPMTSPASSTRSLAGRAAAERIRVCVRKRPLSRAEERIGETDVLTVRDGGSVLVHERKEAVDLTEYVLQHQFYFDEVFSEECTNEDVYKRTAYPLIQHIFNGGKATCFAYGQTGAGKTHTMLGSSPRRPGLYALAARDIFARLVESGPGTGPGPLGVCVSFFEIYCGQLYDLLDHRKRLFAREDGQHVVQIAGLTEVGVESVASLLEVMSWGSRERSRGASGVNCDSSRSHALLQIHLRARTHRLVGRISFVDLAGSERACDTRDPDRQSRMEAAEINQSLLALKECIRALDQELSHTPFRQSKLTQVLKDSFIGNSKTCMIANISPSHLATEHTLNTLRYADRVKELRKAGKSSHSQGGTATPSPKRNKQLGRGNSPTKKVKKESRGTPSPVPVGVLFSPGANLLCSTPKALAGTMVDGGGPVEEVCLDHTTPLRGTLGRGRGQRQQGSERRRDRPREDEGGSDGGAGHREGPRVGARPVWKETVPWETLRGHTSSRRKERERGTEGEREETERERHLRRYHEHLQRFLPSAVLQKTLRAPGPVTDLPHGPHQQGATRGSSHAQELGLDRRGSSHALELGLDRRGSSHALELGLDRRGSSHALELGLDRRGSSHALELGLASRGSSHALELGLDSRGCPEARAPNSVDTAVTRTHGETPWGRGEDLREKGHGGLTLQGEVVGWGEGEGEGEGLEQEVDREKRGLVGVMGGHWERQAPVSPGAGADLGRREGWGALGGGEEAEESWEGERETERGRDEPALLGWSTEEEYSACVSTESSSSNNNIPAERPLSPPRASAALLAGGLNDLSHELKRSNSHPAFGLGPAWAEGDPLRLCLGSPPSGSANIPLSVSAPAVSTPLAGRSRTASGNPEPREARAAVTSSAGAEPSFGRDPGAGPVAKDMAGAATPPRLAPPSRGSPHSAAESSASTMDPLSISLLQVEGQVATDSFLHLGSSSCCASPEGDGGEGGGAQEPRLLLEALLDIQTYWDQLETAVTPHGQRGQQSFDLSSALQCMKGLSGSRDPSLSLTPSPDSFLDTSAHSDRDVLGLIKSPTSPGAPSAQEPAGKTVSPLPLSGQSELSPTEAGPLKPRPVAEKSPGGSVRTEGEQGEGQDEQGLPPWRAVLGQEEAPPTGGEGQPHCGLEDPSQDSDSSVTSSRLATSTPLRSERLGLAQRLVVQAHCEQLEEMDSLCRREEALLSQQPSMDFTDYVLKLEEIMELKAKCVRSMRSQLQIYLSCSTDSQPLTLRQRLTDTHTLTH